MEFSCLLKKDMEYQRYNFTAQSVFKCLFFASNLETNSSKMTEKGTKKKQLSSAKLRRIIINYLLKLQHGYQPAQGAK